MRNKFYLILILVALFISSCQAAKPATQAPAQGAGQNPSNQSSAPTAYPVPQPQDAPPTEVKISDYPAPEQPASASRPAQSVYPDIASGEHLDMIQAKGLIVNGEVAQVIQNQATEFTLMLKDGRSLIVSNVSAESMQKVIDECGSVCGDLKITTP